MHHCLTIRYVVDFVAAVERGVVATLLAEGLAVGELNSIILKVQQAPSDEEN